MNKSKLLVHLHIFYHDQVDFFIEKLKNINGYDWDLIVTYCDENESTNHKLIDFKPNCRLQKVGNVGYDVLPFIKVIKSIDIYKYDYILKLHTKNYQQKLYLNGFKKGGYWWRNELINPLIGSKRSFAKCINEFKNNNKIGFICSEIMLWDIENYWPEDTYMLKDELNRINFKSKYNKFCAGTMFIARADIFRFLQKIDIDENKFPIAGKTKTTGTIAHVYERIFTIAADEFGYEFLTIKNHKEYFMKYFVKYLEKIFSLKNKYLKNNVKHKVITILGIKITIKC